MQTATPQTSPAARQSRPSWKLSEMERQVYARIPLEIDYMDHPSFRRSSAEEEYFGCRRLDVPTPVWTDFPEVPEDVPVRAKAGRKLGPDEEIHLFLRYNYARYRLSELLAAQRRRSTAARARQMVRWYQRAMRTRASLVRANMALVLAMARRTRIANVEFGELVSEGNMALLRSVEKFDASRGYKFSTYACRSIIKSFNRLATKTGRYYQRSGVEYDPEMERSDYDQKKHQMRRESVLATLREVLGQNRARLTDVERTIVIERFAIGTGGEKGKTLTEVGRMVGLTNERVRQIQNLALTKIREALDEG